MTPDDFARARDDLVEDVEWMLSTHEAPVMIAHRLGKTMAALAKSLDRAGRRDLAARFDRRADDGHPAGYVRSGAYRPGRRSTLVGARRVAA